MLGKFNFLCKGNNSASKQKTKVFHLKRAEWFLFTPDGISHLQPLDMYLLKLYSIL